MSAPEQNDPNQSAGQSSNTETAWLACELHDGLMQWIVSARMNIEDVLDRLTKTEVVSKPDLEQLAGTQRVLEAGLEEGRQLIQFLEHCGQPEQMQLADSMASFQDLIAVDLERSGQVLHVETPFESWPPWSAQVSWNVLRIVQQTIRNAAQHAGACEICVRFEDDTPGQQRVVITDDGIGFDTAYALHQSGHFGLSGMHHRAKLIGGKLDLSSKLGEGTMVTLTLR